MEYILGCLSCAWYETQPLIVVLGLVGPGRIAVLTSGKRKSGSGLIDDEYHDFIASNLHLRVQIKNELYEISVRLMMKGI